jgi:hypothetical protein
MQAGKGMISKCLAENHTLILNGFIGFCEKCQEYYDIREIFKEAKAEDMSIGEISAKMTCRSGACEV